MEGPPLECVNYLTNFGFRCPERHNAADFLTDIAALKLGDIDTLLLLEQKQKISANQRHLTLTNGESFHAALEKSQPISGVHLLTMLHRNVMEIYRRPLLTAFELGFQVYMPLMMFAILQGGGDVSQCPPVVQSVADLQDMLANQRRDFTRSYGAISGILVCALLQSQCVMIPIFFMMTEAVPNIAKGEGN